MSNKQTKALEPVSDPVSLTHLLAMLCFIKFSTLILHIISHKYISNSETSNLQTVNIPIFKYLITYNEDFEWGGQY
jgi:hypothetical protein